MLQPGSRYRNTTSLNQSWNEVLKYKRKITTQQNNAKCLVNSKVCYNIVKFLSWKLTRAIEKVKFQCLYISTENKAILRKSC